MTASCCGLEMEACMIRLLALGLALFVAVPALAQSPGAEGAQKPAPYAFNNPIPNIPGKSLLAVVVNYPPGAKNKAHHHAPSAFITAYVLEGAVRSQVDDGPLKVYHAGEYFTEKPGAHHMVSENASATEPAKMLAIFVVDTGVQPLSTPDP
jgi:quercetin dioxygenase-like cupin family protein